MILPVHDLEAAFSFYCEVLEFTRDGMHGPFHVVRVAPDFVLLLVEFDSGGGIHLAFSFSQVQFASVLASVKQRGIPFGDQFDQADNGHGPSPQPGATGDEPGIYMLDPSRHLIEIRRSA